MGLSVDISGFVDLRGPFASENKASAIQTVASGVTATLSAGPATLGVTNGSLSLLFNNDRSEERGVANALNFSVTGFDSATATNVTVKWNTSAVDYSANGASVALSIGGITGATIDVAPNTQSVAITGLSVDISSFVHLNGDFAFQKNASGIQAVASGVTATLSAGPATLGVTNGSLSLLFNNDGSKVLEATGALNFSVTGIASATATNVTVKWNTSAVDYSANGASLALSIGGITGATIDVA